MKCSYRFCPNIGSSLVKATSFFCSYCPFPLYCSQQCRSFDWEASHKQECTGLHPATLNPASSANETSTASDLQKKKKTIDDFEEATIPNKIGSDLGKGSYGTVKLVKEKGNSSSPFFAMKVINIRNFQTNLNLGYLKSEIKIQKKLDHPHILKLYHYFQDQENVYLILEYAENGNLFFYLRKKKCLTEKEAFFFFSQTCLGIDYLHKKGILHRDLKPENLLLDKNGNIKICDFGWSAEDLGKRNTFCGTVDYMAPEVVQNKQHNFKIDIWSLGILLYELLHGFPPFKGRNNNEKFQSILGKELNFKPDLSFEAKDLISGLLRSDPSQRLEFSAVFTHPWINNIQKEFNMNLQSYVYDDTKRKTRDLRKSPTTSPSPLSRSFSPLFKTKESNETVPQTGTSTKKSSETSLISPNSQNKTSQEFNTAYKKELSSIGQRIETLKASPLRERITTEKKFSDILKGEDSIIDQNARQGSKATEEIIQKIFEQKRAPSKSPPRNGIFSPVKSYADPLKLEQPFANNFLDKKRRTAQENPVDDLVLKSPVSTKRNTVNDPSFYEKILKTPQENPFQKTNPPDHLENKREQKQGQEIDHTTQVVQNNFRENWKEVSKISTRQDNPQQFESWSKKMESLSREREQSNLYLNNFEQRKNESPVNMNGEILEILPEKKQEAENPYKSPLRSPSRSNFSPRLPTSVNQMENNHRTEPERAPPKVKEENIINKIQNGVPSPQPKRAQTELSQYLKEEIVLRGTQKDRQEQFRQTSQELENSKRKASPSGSSLLRWEQPIGSSENNKNQSSLSNRKPIFADIQRLKTCSKAEGNPHFPNETEFFIPKMEDLEQFTNGFQRTNRISSSNNQLKKNDPIESKEETMTLERVTSLLEKSQISEIDNLVDKLFKKNEESMRFEESQADQQGSKNTIKKFTPSPLVFVREGDDKGEKTEEILQNCISLQERVSNIDKYLQKYQMENSIADQLFEKEDLFFSPERLQEETSHQTNPSRIKKYAKKDSSESDQEKKTEMSFGGPVQRPETEDRPAKSTKRDVFSVLQESLEEEDHEEMTYSEERRKLREKNTLKKNQSSPFRKHLREKDGDHKAEDEEANTPRRMHKKLLIQDVDSVKKESGAKSTRRQKSIRRTFEKSQEKSAGEHFNEDFNNQNSKSKSRTPPKKTKNLSVQYESHRDNLMRAYRDKLNELSILSLQQSHILSPSERTRDNEKEQIFSESEAETEEDEDNVEEEEYYNDKRKASRSFKKKRKNPKDFEDSEEDEEQWSSQREKELILKNKQLGKQLKRIDNSYNEMKKKQRQLESFMDNMNFEESKNGALPSWKIRREIPLYENGTTNKSGLISKISSLFGCVDQREHHTPVKNKGRDNYLNERSGNF